MFKNYFKIAVRTLIKDKSFSAINILGLSLGLAVTLLIALWVQFESSYDNFHTNKDNIYRVILDFKNGDPTFHTFGLLGETAAQKIPEVDNYVRLMPQTGVTDIEYNNQVYFESKVYYADNSLFDIFDFKLKTTQSGELLDNPTSVLISESLAQKVFGSANPLGESLKLWNGDIYKVVGVFYDPPANSQMKFNLLVSHNKLKVWWPPAYGWGEIVDHITYLKISEKSDLDEVESKIKKIIFENNPYIKENLTSVSLQPLSDIYFDEIIKDSFENGNLKYIYLFSIIGVLILLIACFNFINLSTARSFNRAKEIGLRKTIGSNRSSLIFQFLGESFIQSFLAILLGLIIVEGALPYFNNFVGKPISLDISNFGTILLISGIFIMASFIAGIYPAFYLSGFNPIDAIKNNLHQSTQKITLRKVIVVSQFTASMVLIICTLIINNQIDFMKNADLGFNKEGVIYLPSKGGVVNNYSNVRAELMDIKGIENVSLKRYSPVAKDRVVEILWSTESGSKSKPSEITAVDFNYFELLDFELKRGRYFSKEYSTDIGHSVVINETAAKLLGFDDPINKVVNFYNHRGNDRKIVGIVKDAHVASLKQEIRPQFYYIHSQDDRLHLWGVLLIKMGEESHSETVSSIKDVYAKYSPGYPFNYHYLDRDINYLYKGEETLNKLFKLFSILAIAISCLGLLGLAAFTVQQKIKEIGIRKVLGSSSTQIVTMLLKGFGKWVVFACIIASPVSYYLMNLWLDGYAYRDEISIFAFIFSWLTVLIVTFISVVTQAVKAALKNPTDSLRTE